MSMGWCSTQRQGKPTGTRPRNAERNCEPRRRKSLSRNDAGNDPTERHRRAEVFSTCAVGAIGASNARICRSTLCMAGKFVAAFTFVVGVICSQAAHGEKVRVAIPGLSPNSAFFMVALQKGFYSEEKIEIDVVQAGGGTAIPALISGDMQFSASTGSAVSAILKGAKLKVVMVGQDRPGAQIWPPGQISDRSRICAASRSAFRAAAIPARSRFSRC